MKYPFRVYQTQVEEHIFWIAECPILKGCVGQGETVEEALQELEENEKEWLATAAEFDISIPEIPLENMQEYSGKFTLRVSPTVHKRAVILAKQEGISLNQYVNDAIVQRNAELTVAGYVSDRVVSLSDQLKRTFLNSGTKSDGECKIVWSPSIERYKGYSESVKC